MVTKYLLIVGVMLVFCGPITIAQNVEEIKDQERVETNEQSSQDNPDTEQTESTQLNINFGKIDFEIFGARSDEGKILVALYQSEEGFPKDSEKSIQRTIVEISDGSASGSFEDLSHGQYAISIFHDENNNEILDTNFVGIPKEGIGASRDAKSRFGSLKWKDAVFELADPHITIQITLRYF